MNSSSVNILLRGGTLTTKEILDVLGIPLQIVEWQKARIEQPNEARQKFLRTGELGLLILG